MSYIYKLNSKLRSILISHNDWEKYCSKFKLRYKTTVYKVKTEIKFGLFEYKFDQKNQSIQIWIILENLKRIFSR